MSSALSATILDLAGLLNDIDRRRIARALTLPAVLVDDEDAYSVLVRASADLDDVAAELLVELQSPATS